MCNRLGQKVSMSLTPRQKVGNLGESIVAKYLENKGFSVVDRNFRKSYGEIDVIVERKGKLHFVEVKSVSRETSDWGAKGYRPEENVHPQKMRRLANTIQAYLSTRGGEVEWQFDVVTVEIDHTRKVAHCTLLENVILML